MLLVASGALLCASSWADIWLLMTLRQRSRSRAAQQGVVTRVIHLCLNAMWFAASL